MKSKPETPGFSRRYDIHSVMQFLGLVSDSRVLEFRQSIEGGPVGRRVVRCHRDRRLYAVLIPTRAENLKRILNVLSVMDTELLRKCRELVGVK